jgi:hypothetical protein
MRCDPNAIIRSMVIINPRDPVTPARIRSEERHSQDRPRNEFPQDVARRRHHGARMSIAEQSLDDHALRERRSPAHPHRR